MNRSLALALPLLVAAALLAAATGQVGLVGLITVPIGVACLRGAAVSLSTPGQVLLLMGCGAVAFVLTTFWPAGRGWADEALQPGWAQLGQAALLLAGARLHLARPALGPGGTLGLGLLVFLSCGTVRTGDVYPALLAAFALLGFFALRVDDVSSGGRSLGRRPGRRSAAAALLVLLVSVGMTVGLAAAIPRFYLLAYAWALEWVDERHRAGFHDGPMRLGTLDGLLESDTIVMRVEGDAGDHLRGNVYTHYAHGRWLPASRRAERSLHTRAAEPDAAPSREVRAVIRHAGTDADRFFLPTVAGALRLAPGEARVDEVGVVRTKGDASAAIVVVLHSGSRDFASAAPAPIDRQVPDEARETLEGLEADWTTGGSSPRERIAAIRARLESEFRYSLDVSSGSIDASEDPLVVFLTETRAGHCEYFASAMTLLARTSGVPARLVTGYRIAEHNPFGDYGVVRQRHAHAWTEVYLEGAGWVTVDPSPLGGATPAEVEVTPWFAGLADWTVVWLGRHGIEVLLALLVGGLAGVQIWRIRRDRIGRAVTVTPVVEPPPEWLTRMLDGLTEAGLSRGESEPLESLARRTRAAARTQGAGAGALGEAALLLGRYTAVRYGDEGHVDALRGDFLRWIERSERGGAAATAPSP